METFYKLIIIKIDFFILYKPTVLNEHIIQV
jgi:hypothetical protein